MQPTDHQKLVSLPEGLRLQFDQLCKRLWRVETAAALCLALAALLASYLALFVSDRFWDTPVWLRVGLLAAGLAGLAWFGFHWLMQWVFRPRDQRALAVLVQKQYRRLGDRLLGIVELADEKQRPAYFSPALYRAAIGQVAGEAQQFDFTAAVRERPARLAAFVLAGLLLLALIPLLLSPSAAGNALARWMAPAAAIERFTLVSFEGLPAHQIVAHGEPFDVDFAVRYRSFWKPRRAAGQFERQASIAAMATGERVRIRVPGQVEPGVLRLRMGDARGALTIAPTHRPSLEELNAVIHLPSYLQYPNQTESVANGSLEIVEGSRAVFTGKITRALASAQIQSGDQSPMALRIDGEVFVSEPVELEGVSDVAFEWKDQVGLESAIPWRLRIESRRDSPPVPELTDLLKDSALLESEVLDLRTGARDDFGAREVGVEWQLVAGPGASNSVAPRRFSAQASTTSERTLEETFHFSPGLLAIEPDSVVELRGFATDYFPGRAPSYTVVHRVHVLGNERHAELVRQNLESLLAHLEEVTRLEEKVAADTAELQGLPKEQLSSDEAAERAGAAKDDQARNAAQLEELARAGKKTLQEAFRNPTFSEETLREWAQNLQDMQQLAEGKMGEVTEALKSAQQSAASRSGDLAEAAEKEQDVLEALEEMQRKVNKGLDQLQALTLAQRLRKIATDEKGIASRLGKIVPETIGMFPKELPAKFKNAEAMLASEQDNAHQEAAVLQGEIGRFFERTEKETYGQVNKEMMEARVSEELDRLRGLIQENISMEAMQNLVAWSERLGGWADLLEPKSDESGGEGSGGEGSSSDDALIKELLALLRVRNREINLRQRTGLLERQRAEADNYEESAKGLAAAQAEVREQMSVIQGENPAPALEFPLQDIIDSMQGVEGLLNQPRTDRETDLAQTKAINQLSDVINLINEQQQRGNNSKSGKTPTAEEMAFLMEMMSQQNQPGQGMGVNPKGGGSMAGGTTDRAATGMPGDPDAKTDDSRTVNRAGGAARALPTEFREALENYFKAVEELQAKP